MSRAAYLYIALHRWTNEYLGAFTVKHEALGWRSSQRMKIPEDVAIYRADRFGQLGEELEETQTK